MDMVIGRVIGIFVLFAPLFAVSQETGAMINGKSYILKGRISVISRHNYVMTLKITLSSNILSILKYI